MIRILADIFRWNLRSANGNLVPLSEEIECAISYLTIQKMRHRDRIDVVMDICTRAGFVSCLKFLLEPLIENAIVHGLEKTPDRMKIEVHASVGAPSDSKLGIGREFLLLEVRDNGPGMKHDELEDLRNRLQQWKDSKGSHFGLGNVQGRIKLNFGDPYGIMIESGEKSGLKVRVELPYLPVGVINS